MKSIESINPLCLVMEQRTVLRLRRNLIMLKLRNKTEYLVAGNSWTPVHVLRQLAMSTDPSIRARVAENRVTPLSILLMLFDDPDKDVRLNLTLNRNLPEIYLMQLACDVDADVRYGMAEDPNLPQSILNVLAGDENPYIAQRAIETIFRINSCRLEKAA